MVDVGSGTGLSTRLWRGFEASIIGIEPSPDMRVIAERLQTIDQSQNNISFKEGTSTDTGLANACADIVTVSQALHWMEPDATFLEIARILRARGVFAAIDCDWPPTIHPNLEQAYSECMTRAEIVYHNVESGDARRLVGLAKSQGTVASLLKHGLSEEEIGISDLRQVAERILGDHIVSWFWSYRIRVGLK